MSDPQALKLIRKLYCFNLSLKQLAEALDCKEETLSKIERGEINIGMKLYNKLASYYNIPPQLFGKLLLRLDKYNFEKPKEYQQASQEVLHCLLSKELLP